LSTYGGMFCPPMCPNCFSELHWKHAKPGAPPCPSCGHEHPDGLSFEDYQRAQAEWKQASCTRCGMALDERGKSSSDRLCAACSPDECIVFLNPPTAGDRPSRHRREEKEMSLTHDRWSPQATFFSIVVKRAAASQAASSSLSGFISLRRMARCFCSASCHLTMSSTS
jgi:hypothetical protein